MSSLDHESREKWQTKNRQRVESDNLIMTLALSSKTDNPTASANPIYLQGSSF